VCPLAAHHSIERHCCDRVDCRLQWRWRHLTARWRTIGEQSVSLTLLALFTILVFLRRAWLITCVLSDSRVKEVSNKIIHSDWKQMSPHAAALVKQMSVWRMMSTLHYNQPSNSPQLAAAYYCNNMMACSLHLLAGFSFAFCCFSPYLYVCMFFLATIS